MWYDEKLRGGKCRVTWYFRHNEINCNCNGSVHQLSLPELFRGHDTDDITLQQIRRRVRVLSIIDTDKRNDAPDQWLENDEYLCFWSIDKASGWLAPTTPDTPARMALLGKAVPTNPCTPNEGFTNDSVDGVPAAIETERSHHSNPMMEKNSSPSPSVSLSSSPSPSLSKSLIKNVANVMEPLSLLSSIDDIPHHHDVTPSAASNSITVTAPTLRAKAGTAVHDDEGSDDKRAKSKGGKKTEDKPKESDNEKSKYGKKLHRKHGNHYNKCFAFVKSDRCC
jgi:hypothetical protein